ncbi:MAG TPA: putative baseplate assembly protein [Geobacteraceae bacterium]|nr:putative baseplate assembly protein [Geobacteraceae bacterium]
MHLRRKLQSAARKDCGCARVTAGGYELDFTSGTIWTAPQVLAPYITKVYAAAYSNLPDYSVTGKTPSVLLCSVDGLIRDHLSVDVAGSGFGPFTSSCDIPALYLGFAAPFPADEWIQLLLDVDETRTDGENFPPLLWEYWSGSDGNWSILPVSDEGEGLRRRGYLGFYGPSDQGVSSEFGRDAYWLRLRIRNETPLAVAVPEAVAVVADATGTAKVTLDFSGSSPSDGQRITKYGLSSVESSNLVAAAGPDRTGNDAVRTTVNQASLQLDASASFDNNGQPVTTFHWDMLSSELLVADAGPDRLVNTTNGKAVVELDASGSFGGTDESARKYRWDLVSSERLVADAGPDRIINIIGDAAVVQLDASGSFDFGEDPIKSYKWRLMPTDLEQPATAFYPPAAFLNAILWNTVPVLNSVTVPGEIIGSSNGKANQAFATTNAPIMADIQLYVREPDQPAPDELAALEKAQDSVDGADDTSAFPVTEPDSQGVWVRWQQADHFYASGPSSRHFVLDPASGGVLFGDGEHGKIPPVGRDSIKAVCYSYHQGGSGNVSAGEITVIRNPSGPLAQIKGVRNAEEASGGGDIETIDEVNERGPNTLKHRGKAITVEDFAWLAKDSSGEIAAAWCLPTRDGNGMTREGYVTVVVVPDSTDARPFPRPPLLRDIRQYFASCALVNLTATGNESRITIKGPEYVEVTITAGIVPVNPETADDVKFAIMARLAEFLNPLSGGPDRRGWQLGRDVYLSEIYEELENVAGVDHVSNTSLDGSIQQLVLTMETANPPYREICEGGMVGTFDERIRYSLAGLENAALSDPENVLRVRVYGLKVGDRVNIVDTDNSVVLKGAVITGLTCDGSTVVLDIPISALATMPAVESLALLSPDETIRLPLAAWLQADEQGHATARVEGFSDNENTICIVYNGRRDPDLQFLRLLSVESLHNRVFIPEGHLACSGAHMIEMILEE